MNCQFAPENTNARVCMCSCNKLPHTPERWILLYAVVHPGASEAVLAKPLDVQKSATDLPTNTEHSGWNGKGEFRVADVDYSCKQFVLSRHFFVGSF